VKYEVDYEDSETWKATCDAFKGRWMWDILVYLTREIQNCDHDFDVCRACTAEHISSMLKSDGPLPAKNCLVYSVTESYLIRK
jgi:hypothetical protein